MNLTNEMATWVAAWGTVGLGGALVLLAIVTAVMARQTRNAVREARAQTRRTADLMAATREEADLTRQLAQATKRQAETATATLEHLRDERDLAQRPRLAVYGQQQPGHEWTGPGSPLFLGSEPSLGLFRGMIAARITNVGRGPAVDAFVGYQANQDGLSIQVMSSAPFSVAPRGSAEVPMNHLDRGAPAGLFTVRDASPERSQSDASEVPTFVMCCLDEAGQRVYRFSSRSPGFDVWEAGQEPPPWVVAARSVAPWLQPLGEPEE